MEMARQLLEARQLNLLAVGLLIALLPLLPELPMWLFPWAAGIYLWRLKALKQQSAAIKLWLKLTVVSASLLLLFVSSGSFFSLQGFVSLLVLTGSLKLLELMTSRDYLLLIFLGCLMAACQLLFSNSLLSFSYSLFSLLVLHVILLSVFSNESEKILNAGVKSLVKAHKAATVKMAVIFMQAFVIAIALFIIMPRIGSLWAVPINSAVAKTGVSDSLRAGDIAKLNQDYSVAMRVTFSSVAKPAMSQMYWRGLSLGDFDGRTWRRNKQLKLLDTEQRKQLQQAVNKQVYHYRVMQEANNRAWLYGLDMPLASDKSHQQWQDYSITRNNKLIQRYQYQLVSPASFVDQHSLSAKQFQYYTALPGTENPKSREFASKMHQQLGGSAAYIEKLSTMFRQAFSYTLSPGQSQSVHAIDDFLFNTKLGYCEHFASAGAFLLRAAGIPARIVTGYQGGQWSADQDYLLITQSQAHAWLEYWQAQTGWVRWDPTTFVSPARIESGANDSSLSVSDAGLFSQFSHRSWLNKWRLNVDSLNYQWHRWIINYSSQKQFSLVKQLLGEVNSSRIGLFIVLVFGMAMLPFIVTFYHQIAKKEHDPLLDALKLLDKRLVKYQLQRIHRETLRQFLQRAAIKCPDQAVYLKQISRLSETVIYAKSSVSGEEVQQLERLIRQLK